MHHYMFHLIWKDHDGYYNEEYKNITDLAIKLLELSRKEENADYGTNVIMLIEGTKVDHKYCLDKINLTEKIMIGNRTLITHKLEEPKLERRVKCPLCGIVAKKESSTSTFVPMWNTYFESKYSTLDCYRCTLCSKTFYL